jgi:prolyl-tRNA editing enzyme YbaK/EbsC (Cys-tRNA(Pro) deacylase)
MTKSEPHPAVTETLENCGITYRVFPCDAELADTAIFCEHYGFAPETTANTIIAIGKSTPPKYACGVILATTKLDVNKKISQLLGIKRCSFASGEQTMELTGMQIGGVTPFGLPDIPIYLDSRLINCPELVLGGGNRTTKILLAPGELLKLPNSELVEGLAIAREPAQANKSVNPNV